MASEGSFKLTNSVRNDLAAKIIEGRFDDRASAILRRRISLANKVYNLKYKPAIQRRMAELPNGWLPEADAVFAQFGQASEGYSKLQFDGHPRNLPFSKKALEELPADATRRFLQESLRAQFIIENGALTDEFYSLKRDTDALREERDKLKSEVKGVLYGATTSRSLLERWPEIEPFLTTLYPASVPLPVVQVDSLNARLGLKLAA